MLHIFFHRTAVEGSLDQDGSGIPAATPVATDFGGMALSRIHREHHPFLIGRC